MLNIHPLVFSGPSPKIMNYLAISKKSGHSTKLGIIAQSVLMKMVTCDWTFSVWSCSLLLNKAAEEDNAVEMKRDRGALNMMMWIKKWHVRAINKRELRWHAVFVSKNVVKMFSFTRSKPPNPPTKDAFVFSNASTLSLTKFTRIKQGFYPGTHIQRI